VVGFEKPIQEAREYIPLQGANAMREHTPGNRLTVEVPDHLLILEIVPDRF
jgi:hypothetical protein